MELPLDAISTIFIFLIGLPAILLQTLPAEVRKIVLQERKQEVVVFTVGPIVLATILVIVGVYTSRPGDGSQDAVSRAQAELLWLVVIAVLLLIAGGAALLFTERWRRISVIERLYQSAAHAIPEHGRPAEPVLRSLIELGVQSPAGRDKSLVLGALIRLTSATQERDSYDGAQLESVIDGLEEIFTASPHYGSAENFVDSADLLLDLLLASQNRPHSDDLKKAIQVASLLGRASLRHEQSHIQVKFLDALAFAGDGDNIGYTTWASQAIFEIGSEALEHNSTLVAMSALSRMETLVMRHGPVRGGLALDFVGLLAHFWARKQTGRDYARHFLDHAGEFFEDPLAEVIASARSACMQTARFKTGDYLAMMQADIG
ncbi:MAG: hypothetical protein MJE77_17135 [Proteobacteria bacterium]|nr:hypothetical protein [Pseudomonadota bacterium]